MEILRIVAGFSIGLAGICTSVVVNRRLKNAPIRNKVLKAITRFASVYTISWLFITVAHLLLDKPSEEAEKLEEELDDLSDEIKRDMEEIDDYLDGLHDDIEKAHKEMEDKKPDFIC